MTSSHPKAIRLHTQAPRVAGCTGETIYARGFRASSPGIQRALQDGRRGGG